MIGLFFLLSLLAFSTAVLFTVTQLTAAWAAATWTTASRGPLLLRMLTPATVLGLVHLMFLHAGEITVTLGLEMFKIALILALAGQAAQGRLRFSLRGILLGVTACAALLGFCVQPLVRAFIAENLPSPELLAGGGMVSAVTAASISAATSPRPRWQRASILAAPLIGGGILLCIVVPGTSFGLLGLLVALSLPLHAIFVIYVVRVWVQSEMPGARTTHLARGDAAQVGRPG